MPRLGLGSIDLSNVGGTGQDVVTTIDDFFFESNASGEVNPILTTSRTNLIPYSEDFSGYTIGGITLTSQTETSPINTNDATLVTFTAGGHYLRKDVTVTANTVYTLSFYVKRGTATGLKYRMRDITNNVDILAPTSYYSETSNDWKRIQVTVTTPATCTTLGAYVFSDGGSTGTAFLWGAQLEQDGFATEYIPTTGSTVTVSTTLNDTSEVWDFDGTDIMLEADPEDEGFWEEGSNLVLNHDYADLGSEIITNGGFDTDSNWDKGTGWSIQSGYAQSDGTNAPLDQTNILTIGKTYKLVITVTDINNGNLSVRLGDSSSHEILSISSNGTYTAYGVAGGTRLRLRSQGGFDGKIDSVSVKQVDPNDRWTLSNTTIEDGVLNFPDNSSAAKYAINSNASMMDIGGTYEITLTVNKTAGGVLKILSGTGGSDLTPAISISSSGTHTFIATNNTNGNRLFLYTTSGENFQGTVDNIVVKEYAVQPKDI